MSEHVPEVHGHCDPRFAAVCTAFGRPSPRSTASSPAGARTAAGASCPRRRPSGCAKARAPVWTWSWGPGWSTRRRSVRGCGSAGRTARTDPTRALRSRRLRRLVRTGRPGGRGVPGVRDEPAGAAYRRRPTEDGPDRRPVRRVVSAVATRSGRPSRDARAAVAECEAGRAGRESGGAAAGGTVSADPAIRAPPGDHRPRVGRRAGGAGLRVHAPGGVTGPPGPSASSVRSASTSRARGVPSSLAPNSGRARRVTRNPARSSARRTSPSRKAR